MLPRTLRLLMTRIRLNFFPIKLGDNNVVFLQNLIVYHICRERAMPIGVNLTSTPVTDGGLTIKLRFPLAPLNINSGYTGMMGNGGWGDVELLTLTLSFLSNRKRYKKGGTGIFSRVPILKGDARE